jgi:hypothetical protein
VLAQLALPPRWRAAGERARARVAAALAELSQAVGEAAQVKGVARAMDRVRREWDQLERALGEPAVAARARSEPDWRGAVDWLGLRGVPQERAYAAVMGWWRCGDGFDQALLRLADVYADAVERGGSTAYVLQLPHGSGGDPPARGGRG